MVKGTINYTLPDLNVIAMYQQASKGSTSYNEIDKAPVSGFEVNTEKSYCGAYNSNGGIDKDSSITLSNLDGGGVGVHGLKKGTRCMVYFDYADRTSSEMLAELRRLNSSVPSSSGARSSFSSAIDSGSYTYEVMDDLGTSYYFAGAVNTNWVRLGNSSTGFIYWRIVRINGDGTVRLIYSGTTAPTSSTATVMTGAGTQISNDGGTTTAYAFNANYNDNAYVGYMYGSTGQSSWANTHTNTNNSKIKSAVDTWYSGKKSALESYIDPNVGFCGDRSVNGGTSAGYGTYKVYYGAYNRLFTNKTPNITCNRNNSTLYNNDLYTKTGASRGNKALTNPVGLITADEVALAGGVYGTNNPRYYLYTSQNYWTLSPGNYNGIVAGVFFVDSTGWVNYNSNVSYSIGVRPVINLKSSLTWQGKGTWDSPFLVS